MYFRKFIEKFDRSCDSKSRQHFTKLGLMLMTKQIHFNAVNGVGQASDSRPLRFVTFEKKKKKTRKKYITLDPRPSTWDPRPSTLDPRQKDRLWQRTKHLSEGLRFVVRTGLIYETKNPLISRQLTTNKAFKRGSSFYSSSRPYLQNEDPIDFASADNDQIPIN